MASSHAIGFLPSWLLNMELQRQTGGWIGKAPFRIGPHEETTFCRGARKDEELAMPAMRTVRRGIPEALGTKDRVNGTTEAKRRPQISASRSAIPSLGNASRKVERQKERRREKREHGLEWRGRRESVEGRVYSDEQKAFIAECHRDWANRSKTKGKAIPISKLSQTFNEKFREVPVRTRSSLASLIGRSGW